MKKNITRYLVPIIFCILLGCGLCRTEQVPAASQKPAVINTCRLKSANKLFLTASLPDKNQVPGSRCYLFSLEFGRSGISSLQKPIASKKKAASMTFTCQADPGSGQNLLDCCFVLASKNSTGGYTIISNKMYISNPQKLAKYKYRFPKAASKKGLQTNADMVQDAVDLNIHNSLLNICLNHLIAPASLANSTYSYSCQYQGTTYWFLKSTVDIYDRQLSPLKQTGSVNSAVLLLGWREDLTNLIYPSGREPGHSYYAWNTKNASARKQIRATLYFLARRYSASNGKHGRIVNWIIGNEVNNYKVYNYAGPKKLKQYAQIYANAFRLAYNTITSVYSNARIYISLDHLWNTKNVDGIFPSRKMLDTFASRLKADGSIPWNLAYHPYGSPLTEPRFWANVNNQVRQSLNSPVINMANISILTSYIRKTYGSGTRVILSEQGYTSLQKGMNTEKLQAAAIAYTYLLAEADDMIDSVIIHRHVDHEVEVQQGLSLGLWNTTRSSNREWASTKKKSWKVFKYMDSNRSAQITAFAPKAIGVKTWEELIPTYNQKLYSKANYTAGDLLTINSYRKKASIPSKWTLCGPAASLTKKGGILHAVHISDANPNNPWGFTQKFPGKLKFGSASTFYTTIRVSGAAAKRVRVTLRFYSGKNIFECSRMIPRDQSVKLGVSLKDWKYRKKVTKIQLLITPKANSGWKPAAAVDLHLPVRGKSPVPL